MRFGFAPLSGREEIRLSRHPLRDQAYSSLRLDDEFSCKATLREAGSKLSWILRSTDFRWKDLRHGTKRTSGASCSEMEMAFRIPAEIERACPNRMNRKVDPWEMEILKPPGHCFEKVSNLENYHEE